MYICYIGVNFFFGVADYSEKANCPALLVDILLGVSISGRVRFWSGLTLALAGYIEFL